MRNIWNIWNDEKLHVNILGSGSNVQLYQFSNQAAWMYHRTDVVEKLGNQR